MGLLDSVYNYLGYGGSGIAPINNNITSNASSLNVNPSGTAGSSAQLRPTSSYTAPATSSSSPAAVLSANTNRTTSSNGGGSAPAPSNSSNNNNVNSVPSINYDDYFNPAFDTLNGQEGQLRSDYAAGQNELNTDVQTQKDDLSKGTKKSEALIAQQQGVLDDQKQSAYSQAIRAANALTQKLSAMYGGASSFRGAATEIQGQEFLRNQGQAEQSYQKQVAVLSQHHRDVLDYETDTIRQIDQQAAKLQLQLQQQFQQGLQGINAQRNQLQSQKAAQRINLIQQTVDYGRQLGQMLAQAKGQVTGWAQQQQQLVGQQLQQLYSGIPTDQSITNNPFPTLGGQTQLATTNQTYKGQPQTDDWGNIINPFQ